MRPSDVIPPSIDDPSDDTVRVVGQCADFCTLPGPTRGAPVEQHGPWCQSAPCGREIHATDEGGQLEITVELVRPYLHGTYCREALHADDEVYVRVRTDGEPSDATTAPRFAYLTSGAARQLIASVARAAEQADQLDKPLNNAWERREQDRHGSR